MRADSSMRHITHQPADMSSRGDFRRQLRHVEMQGTGAFAPDSPQQDLVDPSPTLLRLLSLGLLRIFARGGHGGIRGGIAELLIAVERGLLTCRGHSCMHVAQMLYAHRHF